MYVAQLVLISFALCLPLVMADVPVREHRFDHDTWAIRFAADGNLWVGLSNLEDTNATINLFTPQFSLLKSYHVKYAVYGLCVLANGDLFYTDPENDVVVRMSGHNGTQLAEFGVGDPIDIASDGVILYVARQDGQVSKVTMDGQIIASFNLQHNPPYCGGVLLDRAGNIYASAIGAVVVFDNSGQIMAVLTMPVGYASGLVFAANGALIVLDEMKIALQVDVRTAAVQHIYTSSTIAMSAPRTVAIEPSTGNVFIMDIDYQRVFVFTQYSDCNTGDATGNIQLSRLSPDGSDLTGTDVDRRFLYYWNPACGRVTDPYCTRFATDAAVCAVNVPVTNAFAIMRPNSPITWAPLVNPSNGHVIGVLGLATNGTSCGRYQLPSQVVVRLICAVQQDPTFIMDDSAAHPSSSVCSYLLTLQTPVACNVTQTH